MTAESSGRRRGIDQVLWTRVGMVCCMCVALATSISALLTQPKIIQLKAFNAREASRTRVRATAQELAQAWHPRDKANVVGRLRASEDLARFRQALCEALREERGAMQKTLIECGAVVGGNEVRYEIANLAVAGTGGVRVAAIDVAHRLRPWSSHELADFLASRDHGVRIGTLETVARHGGDMPHDALLSCLLSDDVAERAAAVRAVPSTPSVALRSELERLLMHGDSVGTAQAIASLSRCVCAEEYEEQVSLCLGNRSDEVRRAALEYLIDRGRAPSKPERVWAVVVDTLQAPGLRTLALHCLERTGSVDLDALRAQAPMMTAGERLLAARCLIRAGDAMALEVLLDLLACADSPRVTESVRHHLAWLTGTTAAASADQFRAGFERGGRRVRSRHLPPFDLESTLP